MDIQSKAKTAFTIYTVNEDAIWACQRPSYLLKVDGGRPVRTGQIGMCDISR